MSDKVGKVFIVVGEMPKDGVWGHPFSVDPDTWLVPVEPCEHGKYDKHPISGRDKQGDWTYWCPGAGIGDDE